MRELIRNWAINEYADTPHARHEQERRTRYNRLKEKIRHTPFSLSEDEYSFIDEYEGRKPVKPRLRRTIQQSHIPPTSNSIPTADLVHKTHPPLDVTTILEKPSIIPAKIYAEAELKAFTPNSIAFREGQKLENVYIVHSGLVALTRMGRITSQLSCCFDILGAGELLDYNFLCEQQEQATKRQAVFFTCEILEKSTLLTIPVDVVLRLLHDEECRQYIFTQCATVNERRALLYQYMISVPVMDRSALFIEAYAKRFGEPIVESNNVKLNATHAFLAQYVGTSREYLSKFVGAWSKEGHLIAGRGHLTLLPSFFAECHRIKEDARLIKS